MNGFYLGALVVAFLLLVFLAGLGKDAMRHWQTPVSAAPPAAIAQPLVPATPTGSVVTPAPAAIIPATPNPPPVVPLAPGSPAVQPAVHR